MRQANRTWIAPIGAKIYTIKRGSEVIARKVTSAGYTDAKVQAGEVYRYLISAANADGESADSLPVSIGAGLTKPWTHRDIGGPAVAGETEFDGDAFVLEAAGADIGGTRDQFQFASRPADGDTTITAHHVPQLSSQLTRFGVMVRAGSDADAANVAVLIDADTKANLETPGWKVCLTSRETVGAEAVFQGSQNFAEPIISNGRLAGECWLKLTRGQQLHRRVFARRKNMDTDWHGDGCTAAGIPRRSRRLLAHSCHDGRKIRPCHGDQFRQ